MADWIEADVRANGISIHYTRSGGDKPPIVLSHGFTDSGRCWLPVAEVLAADYDVIMPDARGHGHSEAPAENYRSEDRANDLLGLITALGLERPALLGHSMGAETSALATARAPELIGVVLLEDPPWRVEEPTAPPPNPAWREQALAQRELPIEEIIALGHKQSPNWSQAELGPWAESKKLLNPRIFDWFGQPRLPWTSYVNQISRPTLLITADPSRGAIVTSEIAAQVSESNPNIEVAYIAEAGHNIRRDQFDAFLQVVRGFLAKY